MNIFQKLWVNIQLLFKDYATVKLFRLEDCGKPKYGMESQGMDILDNRYIFQGSDNTGKLPSLVVIDTTLKKIIGELVLDFPGCHMNNINFGPKINQNAKWPTLYISECHNLRRCYVSCYVISIGADLSEYSLIQTIYFNSDKHYQGGKYPFDWFVDTDEKYIYTFGMTGVDGEMEIIQFKLPSLRKKEITLTDTDILDSFIIGDCYIYQGSKIIGNRLYALSGLDTEDYPTYLHIIDLQNPSVEKRISIDGLGELEALGKYDNGMAVVNCAYNPTYTFIKFKNS